MQKRKKKKERSGHRRGRRQEEIERDRKREGNRNKQGYMKKKTKHTQKDKGNKTVSEQPDLCISIKNQSVLQPNLLLADKSMQIKGLIGLSCSVKVCGQTL